jgi:hypothetical protein
MSHIQAGSPQKKWRSIDFRKPFVASREGFFHRTKDAGASENGGYPRMV